MFVSNMNHCARHTQVQQAAPHDKEAEEAGEIFDDGDDETDQEEEQGEAETEEDEEQAVPEVVQPEAKLQGRHICTRR